MNETNRTKWMLTAMFGAGLVTGIAIAAGCAWRFLPPPGMPTGAEIIKRVKRELHSDLKITAEQEQKIEPMLEKHRMQLDIIRHDTLSRVLQTIEEKNAELAPVLTPEQREKYERIENERLKRFREHAKE